MSEEEFLKSTPKKLFRLLEIDRQYRGNGESNNDDVEIKEEEEVYIDNIF